MRALARYYSTFFIAILGVAFFTRVWGIHQPAGYMFDEVYHAVTAKLIAQDDPRAFEWWNPPPEKNTAVDWLHPPLAKYTQALGIILFGETSFGWRVSSALFGVGVIGLTMVLALQLFGSRPVSLLAGVLASSDGLLLVMSRIAMNDIHVTFFILLTLVLYLRARPLIGRPSRKTGNSLLVSLIPVGIAAGCAVASKWSGVFAVGLVLFWEGVSVLKNTHWLSKKSWETIVQLLATTGLLLLLVMGVYLLSYSQMFVQGKNWEHLRELFNQTWHYQTHLEATHPYQSKPLQWFFNTKPVWFAVSYASPTTRADVYAVGNPLLFWLADGAVFFALGWIVVMSTRLLKKPETKKQLTSELVAVCFVMSAYLLVWTPWLLSPRIMFFYHYTPAVPLLCVIVAWATGKAWTGARSLTPAKERAVKTTLALLLGAIVVVAVLWYPHWTYKTVPLWLKDSLYFALPQWK